MLGDCTGTDKIACWSPAKALDPVVFTASAACGTHCWQSVVMPMKDDATRRKVTGAEAIAWAADVVAAERGDDASDVCRALETAARDLRFPAKGGRRRLQAV